LEAATICIALVNCPMLRIDLIRRRMSCVLAIELLGCYSKSTESFPDRFELVERASELGLKVFINRFLITDGSEQDFLPRR
jgi:hypothetical protein